MAEEEFHHRSLFKAKQKPYKGSSKGKIKRLNKGKVDAVTSRIFVKEKGSLGKNERANKGKQLQIQKLSRAAVMAKKRVGSGTGAPKIVGLIALTAHADLSAVASLLNEKHTPGSATLDTSNKRIHNINATIHSQAVNMTVFETPRDRTAVLDIAKVADLIMFVMTPDADTNQDLGVDEKGYEFIKLLRAQGLPSFVCCTQGVIRAPRNKQGAVKKLLTRYYHSVLDSKPKVLAMDTAADCSMTLRWIANLKLKEPQLRENRTYMLGEALSFTADPSPDAKAGTLYLRGQLRGHRTAAANQLVHITGYGDFQLLRIERQLRPRQVGARSRAASIRERAASTRSSMSTESKDDTAMVGVGSGSMGPPTALSKAKLGPPTGSDLPSFTQPQLVDTSDPSTQESLEGLTPLDDFGNEQSMITDAEIAEAEAEAKKSQQGEGKSDIQKVWDELVEDDEEESDDGDASDGGIFDAPEKDMDMEEGKTDGAGGEKDGAVAAYREKSKLERDEIDFPDEVQTPKDTPARQRFARYRGLKSVRHSPWDNKESLPLDYSQIVQFEDFAAMSKRVLGDDSGPAPPNTPHVTIFVLKNVPIEQAKTMCQSEGPVLAWPLLQYERKVSVLHFLVKRHPDFEDPVKAKEPMTFDCGFRRWSARPVYSSNERNSPKQVCERFLLQGRFSVASVYARVIFPTAPVLMFKELEPASSSSSPSAPSPSPSSKPSLSSLALSAPDQSAKPTWWYSKGLGNSISGQPLVASGSLLSVDPNRMLIKRVILSGYPIDVHKRVAVCRYMFFNPDDIRWFQPIELWTKYGLKGHIKEPKGTKGHMKCIFDGFIKNHDTVCMSLYKRQFPPWDADSFPC